MNGSLSLRVELLGGESTLTRSECAFPLQVLRPRRLPCGGLELVVLTPCGGLLDGDQLRAEVAVESGASLSLRTQAATQVHAGTSGQSWSIAVAEGASFSYLPHALVPHASAVHHVRMHVSMAADARLFLAETVSPGRTHRGELFAYEQFRSDLDVQCDGRLVARERQLLQPSSGLLPAQLGPYAYFGSAYVFGVPTPDPVSSNEVQLGTSPLASGGACIRALGRRACDVEAALAQLLLVWRSGEKRGWSMGFEPTTAGATIQSSAD